jgi:tetratricopeptide (TPR) repeat protein
MKNRPVFFALFLLVCFLCAASYGSTIDIGDRARLGGVYSLERLGRYAEAMPVITELYHRYPDDLEIKWTYARILGFGGQWKESVKIFDELCAQRCSTNELLTYAHVLQAQGANPKVVGYMKKLADAHKDQREIQSIYINMLVWNKQSPAKNTQTAATEALIGKQKFDQALVQLDLILKATPDDENALLWKARLLSWRGETRISIRIYQQLIEGHPNEVLYYREAARVMGWDGDTTASISLYDKACRHFPENQALKAEAEAKRAYYNNLFLQAEHSYHQWLSLEPDNPEALFDLGQIYARSHQYRAARRDYDALLYKYPNNAQAQAVLDKAQVYDRDWRIESGFLHDEANSQARQVDIRLYDAYEHLEKSFLSNMVFGMTTDQMEYSFPGPFTVHRYRYAASLEQDFLPDMFWKLGYGLSNSSNDNKQLQYRNAEAQVPLLTEHLLLNVSYKRDDFIQNEAMLAEHLQEDRYRGRLTWMPVKPIEIGVDEAHSRFTDGNNLDNYGGDIAWHILYDPTRLTLKYRWQDWRYQKIEPDYFSPGNFPSQRVSLEWEQFLNKNNLYWGANKFSYFLRYEFINDKGNQRGNSGGIGFNWYINKRLTLRVEAQHISYDHPGIYKDDEQTISLIFAF